MFVIQSGSVEIVRKGVTLKRLERGAMFGEMALLESLPRSADARAKGVTRLAEIKPGGFLLKVRRDPTFAFELLRQVSFHKLAKEVPDLMQLLRKITGRGRMIYYVVGNHDIAMENFLDNWGGFVVTPFLNVQSGEKRIRIEHGHLYDPFFVNHPKM